MRHCGRQLLACCLLIALEVLCDVVCHCLEARPASLRLVLVARFRLHRTKTDFWFAALACSSLYPLSVNHDERGLFVRIAPVLLGLALALPSAPLAAASLAEKQEPHPIEMAQLLEQPTGLSGHAG